MLVRCFPTTRTERWEEHDSRSRRMGSPSGCGGGRNARPKLGEKAGVEKCTTPGALALRAPRAPRPAQGIAGVQCTDFAPCHRRIVPVTGTEPTALTP